MTRYVALLRAINVGGHVVKMDRLRTLFAAMGVDQVETFIASGNVIFSSAARNAATLEKRIAGQLETALGYEVATFLRTTAEIGRIARHQPFKDAPAGATLYIGFLPAPLDAKAKRVVASMKTAVDDFHVHDREVYWLCRVKSMESVFSAARLEKALRMSATFRNANTVRRLAAKYPASR